MLTQVQTLLNSLSGALVGLNSAAGAGRAFELLVMTEIAAKLKSWNYDIDLFRSDGTPFPPGMPKSFIQRGGAPGPIAAAAAGVGGPTSIGFKKAGANDWWEIWNGVQFQGRSGSFHEIDISIVPKSLGDAVRVTGGRPLGHGWVSIECKHVAANGSPDEMRAFIARIYDATVLYGHLPYYRPQQVGAKIFPPDLAQAGYGNTHTTYRQENQSIFCAIARTSGFSAGTVGMAQTYFVERHQNIAVGSVELDALTTSVCNWIDANI